MANREVRISSVVELGESLAGAQEKQGLRIVTTAEDYSVFCIDKYQLCMN
jgi:hypothetical protein